MTTGAPRDGEPPSWSTYREAAGLIIRGVTFRTAFRVAVVVGTLLTAINQGEILVRHQQTPGTRVRIVFNYVIPFLVASIGYLAPLRREK